MESEMFQGCGQPRIVTWTKEESEMATKIFGGSQHGGYGAGMSQQRSDAGSLAEKAGNQLAQQMRQSTEPETDIARQMGRLQASCRGLSLALSSLTDALACVSLRAVEDDDRVSKPAKAASAVTALGGDIGEVAEHLDAMYERVLDAKRRLQLP
jgi:hypothetical protein